MDNGVKFIEGDEIRVDTVDDVDSTLDPRWNGCDYLHEPAAITI